MESLGDIFNEDKETISVKLKIRSIESHIEILSNEIDRLQELKIKSEKERDDLISKNPEYLI